MELTSSSTQQGDQLETFYPPRLDYSVQAQIFPPTEQLDCTIQVRGATEANRGKALFFKLRSKTVRNGELCIYSGVFFCFVFLVVMLIKFVGLLFRLIKVNIKVHFVMFQLF